MKKNLEYYLSLPYKVEVAPIPEDEGGGFMAFFPEIGQFAIIGDGETCQDAMANLYEMRKIRFAEFLEAGHIIPEPETVTPRPFTVRQCGTSERFPVAYTEKSVMIPCH